MRPCAISTWTTCESTKKGAEAGGMTGPACSTIAPCSRPSTPLRAACGGGLRPALTATVRGALRSSGRDGETPFSRTKKHHQSCGPAILQNLTHRTCGSVDRNAKECCNERLAKASLPVRERGSKLGLGLQDPRRWLSLPVRERGSKLLEAGALAWCLRRSPCGSVDRNQAPAAAQAKTAMSLPVRERGSKLS